MKKNILILNGQYLPGFKGGGPIQSCANMVENLYEHYNFYVICSDRDFKSDRPYENIHINAWNKVGHANVYYLPPEKQNLNGFKKVLNELDFDVLYLNGFFSPIFTIKPLVLLKLRQIKKCQKIILTPRGDFTGGCENKKLKKYTYIYLSKIVGLYKNLIWHATSTMEKNDILHMFPKADVVIIPNLPAKFEEKVVTKKKNAGELNLIFISRIFPKKNLKYALEVLQKIPNGNVVFDIYGPMEDLSYWNECEKIIKNMPENVKVKYCGEIEHNEIPKTFEKYHSFFFPTLGENYGHVIVEAMMNNCLCILSKNTTPWDDYIELLGIGAPLNSKTDFAKNINKLIDLNQNELNKLLRKNNDYLKNKLDSQEIIEKYIEFLDNK